MHSKSVLDQQDITRLLDAARQRALAEQWAVTIAVVDDGGHPLALGRRETRDYEQMVNGGRTAFVTAPLLTSLEGGVPLRVDGQVIGAIGVSGVRPEQDAQVAKAGATGL